MTARQSTLTFLGGAGSVTGAHFLFDTGGKKILIDCGLVQGNRGMEENYEPFPYDPATIDVLFITHAHADHIGRVPKLVREGFKGVIYSTAATKDLSAVMFDDAVRILAEEARAQGRAPLYEAQDAERALSLWKEQPYHEPLTLGDDITVRLRDAGHILGAAMIEFERDGVRFVATGDLGNSPAPLLRDTEQLSDVQYLLMESVYGDRVHERREDRIALLRETLIETYTQQRTLLIPSFSIQRTQLLVYEINKMVESGEVPEMPVYLDSPLASKVTDVFRKYTNLLNETVQAEIAAGDDIFAFPEFTIVENPKESQRALHAPAPKVIIAGSGMSVGGRVLMHEKGLLGDPKTTILFVGYQGVGTLGRRIQDGEKIVTIEHEKVRVRAQRKTIHGFSAHKDRDGLIAFVESAADSLREVFVAMGEPRASLFLVQRLRDFLGVQATAPERGDTKTLAF